MFVKESGQTEADVLVNVNMIDNERAKKYIEGTCYFNCIPNNRHILYIIYLIIYRHVLYYNKIFVVSQDSQISY